MEKKIRKIWKSEKLREKNVEIMGKKSSPTRMTLRRQSTREEKACSLLTKQIQGTDRSGEGGGELAV